MGETWKRLGRLVNAGFATWSEPASLTPLVVLRVGLASALLLQAVGMWTDLKLLFGGGLFRPELAAYTEHPMIAQAQWLASLLRTVGLSSIDPIRLLFGGYVLALICLLFGIRARVAAWAALLLHVLWCASGLQATYGVDTFARIGLFVCAVSPVGAAFSVDAQRVPANTSGSIAARRGLLLLQCLLAIAYGFSGYAKAQGHEWWNGESIHRSLYLGSPRIGDMVVSMPFIAIVAGWGTLAIELGWPLLIWFRATRRPLLLATMMMHFGIFLFLHLTSFCAVMILLNFTLYLFGPSGATEQSLNEQSLLEQDTDASDLVLFDGECGLCKRTIAWIQRRDSKQTLRVLPFQEAPSPPMSPALSIACADAIHVLTSDGRTLRAGRAMLFILDRLGSRWVRVLSLPPFVWGVEVGYALVAHHRNFFSRFLFTGLSGD